MEIVFSCANLSKVLFSYIRNLILEIQKHQFLEVCTENNYISPFEKSIIYWVEKLEFVLKAALSHKLHCHIPFIWLNIFHMSYIASFPQCSIFRGYFLWCANNLFACIFTTDEPETQKFAAPHEDHSYSASSIDTTRVAEPVDAAIQVMVSGILFTTFG